MIMNNNYDNNNNTEIMASVLYNNYSTLNNNARKPYNLGG